MGDPEDPLEVYFAVYDVETSTGNPAFRRRLLSSDLIGEARIVFDRSHGGGSSKVVLALCNDNPKMAKSLKSRGSSITLSISRITSEDTCDWSIRTGCKYPLEGGFFDQDHF